MRQEPPTTEADPGEGAPARFAVDCMLGTLAKWLKMLGTEQLHELISRLGLELRGDRLLSRCLPCNEPTFEIGRDEAAPEVPPYVLAIQPRFRRCPSCKRVYWGATHRDRMPARLRELFPAPPPVP